MYVCAWQLYCYSNQQIRGALELSLWMWRPVSCWPVNIYTNVEPVNLRNLKACDHIGLQIYKLLNPMDMWHTRAQVLLYLQSGAFHTTHTVLPNITLTLTWKLLFPSSPSNTFSSMFIRVTTVHRWFSSWKTQSTSTSQKSTLMPVTSPLLRPAGIFSCLKCTASTHYHPEFKQICIFDPVKPAAYIGPPQKDIHGVLCRLLPLSQEFHPTMWA